MTAMSVVKMVIPIKDTAMEELVDILRMMFFAKTREDFSLSASHPCPKYVSAPDECMEML